MNAQEYLNLAAQKLQDLYPAQSGRYELAITNGEIIARKYDRKNEILPLIARLTSEAVNNGCTSGTWNLILIRIREFIEKGMLS